MGCGAGNDVARAKRKSGKVGARIFEAGEDVVGLDVKHRRGIDLAVVEDSLDVHLVLEGADLELVEEGSLRLVDLLAFGDKVHGRDDFNLCLDQLGGDTEGLEEGSLLRVKTSRAGRDNDIRRGNGTGLGGGTSCLLVESSLDFAQIAVGEDHADVADELLEHQVEVGALLPASLSLFVSFAAFLWLLNEFTDGAFHVSLQNY